MIVITDKVTCCGCWACENICPKHCVVMKEDNEGFRYPEVDVEVCIECGKGYATYSWSLLYILGHEKS